MNVCHCQPGLDDQQLSRLLEGDLALSSDKKENGSDWYLHAFICCGTVVVRLVHVAIVSSSVIDNI